MEDFQHTRTSALSAVRVPQHVIQLLADLRSYLQEKIEPPVYVSDRRLVKAVALMQVRLSAAVVCLRLSSRRWCVY
jgi:MoxR-like ATPase